MSMSDPIADMLTRIRNGLARNKVSVLCRHLVLRKLLQTVTRKRVFVDGFAIKEAKEKDLVDNPPLSRWRTSY
ncbi:MAG: hypothetical protein CM1200mP18_12170 [Gammaproteobacteria bacterium]|nr:MAG: hypothetical protein CM1200mP18_12170 [Gammaproteobacteria bacterium]